MTATLLNLLDAAFYTALLIVAYKGAKTMAITFKPNRYTPDGRRRRKP